MEIYFLIGILGLISGFLSGLLGIGGGIVMAPLLLYVPPFLGMEPFTMQSIAGLTIVQGVIGCLSGSLIHKKLCFVSKELSLYMGSTIFIFAAIGGACSRYVSNNTLLFIFACLAFIAAFFMLLPISNDKERPNIAVV